MWPLVRTIERQNTARQQSRLTGTSPDINKNTGRDHWGPLCTLAMWGGGLQVIGESSDKAEVPKSHRVTPRNLMATIFHVLGISPKTSFHDPGRRPIPMLHGSTPFPSLFSISYSPNLLSSDSMTGNAGRARAPQVSVSSSCNLGVLVSKATEFGSISNKSVTISFATHGNEFDSDLERIRDFTIRRDIEESREAHGDRRIPADVPRRPIVAAVRKKQQFRAIPHHRWLER